MEPKAKISGTLPVLQMPYRDDDAIDYDVLQNEINFVIEAGSDGVVLALASELLRLSHDERLELSRTIPEMAGRRCTVTISVGAESTRQAVRYAAAAETAGAGAVMAIPPVATGLPESSTYQYYKTIHDAISIPLIVQDASGYMGQSLSVELQARMRDELGPRIYFKPEAQPIGLTLTSLQEALHQEGVIFEGSGGLYLIDSYRRGISGTMPGCDLIRGICAVWQALEKGDDDRAYQVYYPLAALVILQMASLDQYLAIEKYLLCRQGIFKNQIIRQPAAYTLDPHTAEEVDRIFTRLEAVL